MPDSFHHLVGLCAPSAAHGSLLTGLFIAGLAGGLMHCAPMCGGFVLGQVADRMIRLPACHMCEWRRLSAAALVPYHLGRLTTYGMLGALFAGSAGALSLMPWLRPLSAVLLTLAALAFLVQALSQILPVSGLQAPVAVSRMIGRLAALARRFGKFPLGMALGFLPCGLVYGALFGAASSANPAIGAAGMVAFGAGTVPALVVVGALGQATVGRWRRASGVVTPVAFTVSTVMLLGLALQQNP